MIETEIGTKAPRSTPKSEIKLSGGVLTTVWAAFVVSALLLMGVIDASWYSEVIVATAVALALACVTVRPLRRPLRWSAFRPDRSDLLAIGGLYVVVVGLFRLAFGFFTPNRAIGLFLAFGGALVAGVVGPIAYTVVWRHRPLSSLGLGFHRWRSTVALGLLFASVQFSITLWGYDLPSAIDWVPLLVMSVAVGLFEALFFRGFVQSGLQRSFGTVPAVLGAAALYGAYHVGYGMEGSEILFLFGLGVVYAVAYRLTENVLILWPLLTPLGSFFANLEAGDLAGELPWASILGFADVLGLMALGIWLARKYERGRSRAPLLVGGRSQEARR